MVERRGTLHTEEEIALVALTLAAATSDSLDTSRSMIKMHTKNSYSIELGKKTLTATLAERAGSRLTFEVEGASYTATIRPLSTLPQRTLATPSSPTMATPRPLPPSAHSSGSSAVDHIITPLPGLVAAVLVEVGQLVEVGTPLAVVEAMKMENSVPSPRSGTVLEVLVVVGQELAVGDALVRIS